MCLGGASCGVLVCGGCVCGLANRPPLGVKKVKPCVLRGVSISPKTLSIVVVVRRLVLLVSAVFREFAQGLAKERSYNAMVHVSMFVRQERTVGLVALLVGRQRLVCGGCA